jgi:hypothetical protein
MTAIGTDNSSEIGFIYKAVFFQKRVQGRAFFHGSNSICLNSCGDPGIRNHGGKKECVCMTTGRTKHACNRKDKNMILKLYPAFVRAIENETAGKTASAGDPV